MRSLKSLPLKKILPWLIGLLLLALAYGLWPRGHSVRRPRECDLLTALSTAVIEAPPDHVNIQAEFPVGTVRPALYAHPTSSITFADLSLYEQPQLEFSIGLHQDAWSGPGDGVRFAVILQDRRGREHYLFSQELDPVHNPEDRGWIDVSLDLSDFANQTVSLIFCTDPRDNPLNDWAAWGQPHLSSQEILRVGRENQPNVILISIDTLRADHLSAYGYERDTSPHLDQLAKGGVLFEQAYCQAAVTTPSHASMLSSLYPRTHQLYDNGYLSQEVTTMPQILQGYGYHTAAVVGVKFLLPTYSGLGQGFDEFFSFAPEDGARAERRAEEVSAQGIAWIEEHYRDKFFIWLHYYDPHWSYRPPPPYDTLFYQGNPYDPQNDSMANVPPERRRIVGDVTDLAHPIAQYDGEIAYTDAQIGHLLEVLEALDLLDNTLIVVVADHGESLSEHNVYFEHWALYDDTTHVPFILHYPRGLPAGRRIAGLVEAGVDILPTVLDLHELPPHPQAEGRSLLSLIEGEGAPRDMVFSEQRNALAVSARTAQQKFILHRASSDIFPWHPMQEGKQELYDLRQDPHELINLLEQEPAAWKEQGEHFLRTCQAWIESADLHIGRVDRKADPELEEILKELGY
ncbi:MAG: sulfatase [Chloroflexia bacterium]|nr:sulfatase [Chloroflexia bacterium]